MGQRLLGAPERCEYKSAEMIPRRQPFEHVRSIFFRFLNESALAQDKDRVRIRVSPKRNAAPEVSRHPRYLNRFLQPLASTVHDQPRACARWAETFKCRCCAS